ncbi:MAG: CYTH and CHAD domain-containing protein [Glaciimonas sp.]|nr:CYTH and CHAD domain-containing protein [Glaciimonas sp.]
METELKLLLEPVGVALFRRHPLLRRYALAKPTTQQLTSTYFDTPDGYFRRHGAGLRVRSVNRQRIQTLKADAQVAAGLHQREEWESSVNGGFPDLTALAELVGRHSKWGRRLLGSDLSSQLVPIFITKFRRTLWQLRLAHGEEVELVLDQGAVIHAATSLPISEIELELKSGAAAGLFEFALELQQTLPLRVGNISKAERGYALLMPQAPTVATAEHLMLTSDLNVEQGLQAIVGNCLAQIQGNEDGVKLGSDPESVHQMRVGLRRLRCAIGLFTQIVPCPAGLLAELKWLLGVLGAARDWEVFSGTLSDSGPVPVQEALMQTAQTLAQRHRHQAELALSSVRYAAFLLAIGSWLHNAQALQGERTWVLPLTDFAANTLQQCRKKMQKRIKRLRRLRSQDDLSRARHRVRIAAKKLRYASEFFQSLYRPRPMHAYLKALSGLQDRLGRLNDIAVAGRLLQQLAHGHPELAFSAGLTQGYLDARTERQIRILGRHGRRCMRVKIPVLQ